MLPAEAPGLHASVAAPDRACLLLPVLPTKLGGLLSISSASHCGAVAKGAVPGAEALSTRKRCAPFLFTRLPAVAAVSAAQPFGVCCGSDAIAIRAEPESTVPSAEPALECSKVAPCSRAKAPRTVTHAQRLGDGAAAAGRSGARLLFGMAIAHVYAASKRKGIASMNFADAVGAMLGAD